LRWSLTKKAARNKKRNQAPRKMRANHHHHHQHNAGAANANVNNNQPPPTATASTAGYFSGAPVTKFLAMIMVFFFVLLHSYSSKRNHGNNNLFQWLMMKNSNNSTAESSSFFLWVLVRSLLRRLVSTLTFSTTGEMVTGGLLWAYWSRKFEREMGSKKYSIFVVWILLVSGLLGETIYWWQQQRGESLPGASTNFRVRPGPYPFLGALAWLYHWFTPRLYPRFMGVLGLYFSEKAFVYMWFTQVMLSASGSGGGLFGSQSHSNGRLSALTVVSTGFVASMLFTQWNALFSKLVDHIPPPLVAALSQFSQRVLMEIPPRILVPHHFGARGGVGGNIGGVGGRNNVAAAANAAGMAGAGAATAAAAARHFHEAELAAAMAASRLQAQPPLQQQEQAAQPPPPPPDPAAVEQLVMMGFDRAQVVQALQSCNNDVQRAADRLLTESGVM